jgi:hypothetical protein
LFVALPVAGVAIFSALTENWLAGGSWFLTAPRSHVTPLLAAWVFAGIGLILAVPIFLAALAALAVLRYDEDIDRPSINPGIRRAGQGVLVAIATLGTWALVDDIIVIL